MDKTELLLKEITEASGVSGYEAEVRELMASVDREKRARRIAELKQIKRELGK